MPYRDRQRGGYRGVVKHKGQRSTALFRTKKEAAAWEAEERKRLKRAEKTIVINSLVELYESYLDSVQLRQHRQTYNKKRFLGRRIIAEWGDRDVTAITPAMVSDFIDERARSKSNNAANDDRKNLRKFFSWLKQIRGIPHNPVLHIDRLPHQRAPQRIPTQEEVLRLIAVTAGQDRVLLLSYLHTAGRKSEIMRWTWAADVNFESRQVRLGTRKTRDSFMEYEWLPMNQTLYEALWGHYQKRDRTCPWVFPNTYARHAGYGERYTERAKWMKRLCKAAGIDPPFGFHALRRYVASILADTHKVSAKAIQRVLRHKNISTTERYIGNVNRDLEATMGLLVENKESIENERGKETDSLR